jgi:FtsP/CotA-like multicopper oxidase with cupredoxin domain
MVPSIVPTTVAAPSTLNPTPELFRTMVPVVWDSNNEATIEFCEDFGSFGYRLPGEFTCGPAGLVIRVIPGYSYVLTLSNKSTKRTNLVVQNLHVSASGNANDLYRIVYPDNCLKYHFDIPGDHIGGTHLILSHLVSELSSQIPGGAYSMLIVEDDTSPLTFDVPGSADKIISWMQNELLLIPSRDGDTILGNGKRGLQFNLIRNEWYRFRVAAIDIAGNTNDLVIPDACEARAVAHDGVWRFKVPKDTAASIYPMTASDRVDLAMKCTVAGIHNVTFAGTTVVRFIVAEGPTTDATPYDESGQQWVPARPKYLSDMMQSTVDRTFELRMSGSNINEFSYSQLDTFDYNSVVEMNLKDIDMHPLWMHVHWMQIVSGCANHYDVGEFYSIVRGIAGQYCNVRVRIADFSDKFDVHCSILTHMETGALVWFNVTSGGHVQDWTDRDEFTCV